MADVRSSVMADVMTLAEAKRELAQLEADTRKRINALRSHIRVMLSQEDPQDRSNRIEEELNDE